MMHYLVRKKQVDELILKFKKKIIVLVSYLLWYIYKNLILWIIFIWKRLKNYIGNYLWFIKIKLFTFFFFFFSFLEKWIGFILYCMLKNNS